MKWKEYQHRYPSIQQVIDWSIAFPNCAVGLPTGRGLKLFVIDLDSSRAHRWLLRRGKIKTWTAKTPRGWHYFFRYPDFHVGNSTSDLARGVDVRGDGGMVVAAGSFYGAAVYTWVEGRSPADVRLADAPAWLLEQLEHLDDEPKSRKPAGPSAAVEPPRPVDGVVGPWARAVIDGELGDLAAAEEGSRNDTLARVSFVRSTSQRRRS